MSDDDITNVGRACPVVGAGHFDGDGKSGEEWQVASIADFSGGGRGDTMWEGEDGVLWLWRMEGISIARQNLAGFRPEGWNLV